MTHISIVKVFSLVIKYSVKQLRKVKNCEHFREYQVSFAPTHTDSGVTDGGELAPPMTSQIKKLGPL